MLEELTANQTPQQRSASSAPTLQGRGKRPHDLRFSQPPFFGELSLVSRRVLMSVFDPKRTFDCAHRWRRCNPKRRCLQYVPGRNPRPFARVLPAERL